MNNTGFYGWIIVGIVFLATTVLVFGTENTSWPAQVLAACLGALVTIIATRLLLASQSKVEDKAKRDLEIYNAKLEVYSDFVSSMYEALKDNEISESEFIDLRTKLLGKVCFYVNDSGVIKLITKQLDRVEKFNDTDKMALVFAGITSILQKDLRKMEVDTKDDIKTLFEKFNDIADQTLEGNGNSKSTPNSNTVSEHVVNKENEVSNGSERLEKQEEINKQDITNNMEDNENKQENAVPVDQQYINEQSWHFNGLDQRQFDQLKEKKEEYELSLVEYGEYWRTNLLKQIEKGDIIMLFRRGGYGYVGAFKAVGMRLFDFKKKEEEILFFDKEPQIVKGEDFNKDVEEYDIYKSKEDGADFCSNLIVQCIAYVPEGVGNPGGVYRRTISRYDSHYAWLLKQRFQEKGQWIES